MYASVRRYRLNSGSLDDLLHVVDSDFAETIQEIDGFVGYQVMDCGDEEILSISIFRDRDAAEESADTAAQWVRDTLEAQFDVRRVESLVGEIVVSRAQAGMLEPARPERAARR